MIKTTADLENYLLKQAFLPVDYDADRDFDRFSRLIVHGYADIKSEEYANRTRPRKFSSSEWLKFIAYVFVQYHLADDLEYIFQERIKKCKPNKRGPKGDPNIFHIGLEAIFAHASGDLQEDLKLRIGRQLILAHRHFVPKEFLIGFLTKNNAVLTASETQIESIDPVFVSWIAKQHLEEDVMLKLREIYPKKISTEISSALNAKAAHDDEDWFI